MATTTYSEAKDLRKGEELMIFLGDKPVAYTTSHTLDVSVDTQDVSSKMSGDYDSSMPGKIAWELSIEALTSMTAGHESKNALMVALTKRVPIHIEACTVVRGTTATGKTFTKGQVNYQGDCIITKLNEKSSHGEYETFSATLKGSGPLCGSDGKPLSGENMPQVPAG